MRRPPTSSTETTIAVFDAADGGMSKVSSFDGQTFDDGVVHFGYKDGISQPRVEGLREDAHPDSQPLTPTGAVVLGYPSQFENLVFTVPQPELLGRDGTYNAFRVLAQDVVGFADFVAASAETTGLDPDMVAAKLLGRWPNGNPLTLCPVEPGAGTVGTKRVNDYGYDGDPDGLVCPIGSHMRRANPRDSKVVQRGFGHSRRIVRRGVPYGPQWKPGSRRRRRCRSAWSARQLPVRQPVGAVRGGDVRLGQPRAPTPRHHRASTIRYSARTTQVRADSTSPPSRAHTRCAASTVSSRPSVRRTRSFPASPHCGSWPAVDNHDVDEQSFAAHRYRGPAFADVVQRLEPQPSKLMMRVRFPSSAPSVSPAQTAGQPVTRSTTGRSSERGCGGQAADA